MSENNSDALYHFEKNSTSLSLTLQQGLSDVQWGEIEELGANVLKGLEEYEAPLFIVDLSPLDYMGSAMVALIVRIWKVVKAKKGNMSVVCPNENVLEVISLAGLDKVWNMADNREEACQSLGVQAIQSGSGSIMGGGMHPGHVPPTASSPVLSILAGLTVLVAIVGIILQLAVPAVNPNVGFGIALGGATMALLVGLVSMMNDRGVFKYIGLGAVVCGIAILITALLNKP